MADRLTDRLCTRCGLCCDGTLLDDVEITDAENTRLEALGVNIDGDEPDCMPLPCSALKGTRCSIYRFRPGTCKTFECKLLIRARSGNITPDQALEIIRETRGQADQVRRLCRKLKSRDGHGTLNELISSALASEHGSIGMEREKSELSEAATHMRELTRHFL